MTVIEAIRGRRTFGKMSGEIPRDTIRELIELATLAPNHRMTEPWRFTVVTGPAREQLGRFWAERAGARIDAAARDAFVEGESKKPLRAPTLIIVSTRTDSNPEIAEEDFAATSAAVQNLLIAAQSKGIYTGWKTGKMIHDPEVKKFLGLDPSDRVVATIYMGTEALDEMKNRPRKLDDVITWMSDAEVPATLRA
jgi:nitroreductase